MSQLSTYLVLFAGGGLGTLLRHGVNRIGPVLIGPTFPGWTLFINVTGSFVMGMVAGWFFMREPGTNEALRLFLMTGVLGGYTTFSAFSLDAALLWERGDLAAAGSYVLGSVVLSLVGVGAGLALIRAVVH